MKKMMKMVSLLLLVTLLFIGCEQSGTKPPETQQPGASTGGGGQLIQKELVAKLLIQVLQAEQVEKRQIPKTQTKQYLIACWISILIIL